jgi:formate-dependent nitrite reductase membrane component NrfD
MSSDDVRGLDPLLAGIEGEGSQQRVGDEPPGALEPVDVWKRVPGRSTDLDYFGRPVLKEPVWIWTVPAYFYAGGAAGAAVVLGETATALGRGEVDGLARKTRWIGAAGTCVGTILLIADLGRPERFLNMLRVFRPTSAMSVGSWLLAASTPIFSASAALRRSRSAATRLDRTAGGLAAALGLPLAGYTAVLLSSTAIPIWQQVRRELPFLFAASAMSSATSLLSLMKLGDDEADIVERFGFIAEIGELVAGYAVERRARATPAVMKSLEHGAAGALWRFSKAANIAGLLLQIAPGGGRRRRVVAGIVGTLGSLALRYGVVDAGKASARDAHASFEQQRSGRGAAEVTGRPAVAPP